MRGSCVHVSYPGAVRAWFTVFILMLAYVLSFVDRMILNLLVGPIKADLQLTDTEMSLLMGLSFALFYTICGIPLGRLADSKSRRGLIAAGVVVWSAMTAACGLAKNYWQFFLARVGVGVGEAALSPAAYSLITDSFPPHKRATALSLYSMGIYLGSGLALLVGAKVIQFALSQGETVLPLVGEVRPWQLIFLLLGAGGIAFSLVLFALKEPPRQGMGAGQSVPLREVLNYFGQNRATIVLHNLGFACLAFCGYGASAWIPEFFVRTYGLHRVEVGQVLGWLTIVAGSAGILCGGALADWLHKRGYADANLRVGMLAAVIALPAVTAFIAPTATLAYAINGVMIFALAMPFGVAPAALQEIMPNAMRGQASALYLFVITLIGLGVGPTAVALVTDYVFGDDMALRYSLLLACVVAGSLALVLLGFALKPYRASLQRLQQWQATPVAGPNGAALSANPS
ncbi:MAG: MFS transporter [Gammaproteobacteria bacterium]